VGAPAGERTRRRAGGPRASWLAGAAWRGERGRRGARRCAAAGSAASWVRSWPARHPGTAPGPHAEVLGDHREFQPDRIERKLAEGQVLQPCLLGGADAVFCVGAAAMQALELDRVAVEVGQRGLEAVSVDVGERQLRARMRVLATHDHARAFRPVIEVEHGGDLGDLRAVTHFAVLTQRRSPRVLGQQQDRAPHLLGQIEPDQVVDPGIARGLAERERRASRVGAQHDLRVQVSDDVARELFERLLEHRDLIRGAVRRRVARAQHPRQRLAARVQIGQQRMKPEAALEVHRRAFLLGVRADQRRVDIDHDSLWPRAQLPRPRPRSRPCGAQRLKRGGVAGEPVDQPERGRVGGDRAEQRLLIAHRAQVREAVTTVGEHHREIPDHAPRIVPAPALRHAGQRTRELAGEADTVGGLGKQSRARVRHQARSVRRHIYRERASCTHHPQGDLQDRDQGPSASPRIPVTPDVSGAPIRRGARR